MKASWLAPSWNLSTVVPNIIAIWWHGTTQRREACWEFSTVLGSSDPLDHRAWSGSSVLQGVAAMLIAMSRACPAYPGFTEQP